VREGAGPNGSERIVLRAGGFLNPGDKVRPVAGGKTAAAYHRPLIRAPRHELPQHLGMVHPQPGGPHRPVPGG
jgi:hypothetical protein